MTVADHDQPGPDQLLAAVHDLLTTRVIPALQDPLRFEVRVAASAVAIARRELAARPALLQAEAQGLEDLGCQSAEELSVRIRAGELDGRWDELLAWARRSVAARLGVVNPTYASAGRGREPLRSLAPTPDAPTDAVERTRSIP